MRFSGTHILGLCPLLAVSHKLVYALCLGLCTALVMAISGLVGPLLVQFFPSSIRLVVHMLVIGTFVIVVEIILSAFFYELYLVLGLFVPLIITNCAILAHCELQSAKPLNISENLTSSMKAGAGFVAVLVSVAAVREILGHGTLFADIELFLGEGARWLHINFEAIYSGVPIVLLPCGAFFALAIVIASFAALERRSAGKQLSTDTPLQYHARR